MIEILRSENGEIVFYCKCGREMSMYCDEEGKGEMACGNCGRMYVGTSFVSVLPLPERDIAVLKERINGIAEEMALIRIKREDMQTELYQLSVELTKAKELLLKWKLY